MPQKLLHHPEVCAGFAGQGGEGVAAAVRGQVTHGRFGLAELAKESVVVTGEVSGMQQRPVFSAEQELALVGQCAEAVRPKSLTNRCKCIGSMADSSMSFSSCGILLATSPSV